MRRLFFLIPAALIGLFAVPVPGAAQETPDTAAISVVRAVMEHRIIWLQDPTLFNPCHVFEATGRPDDLRRRLGPHASRLLDPREKPCASPTLRAPISLFSVEVGDSTAAVQLRVTRGEYAYTEDYTLRKPEWQDWWMVSEIRMSGWGQFYLPPPRLSPPEDTVTERTYHLSPPQLTLPKDTVSGAGSLERPGAGDDLSVDEAALVEALAAEIGGGDVSAPHRWFVEDRMIVHPEHGIMLDRPDLYESHPLTEETRQRLATHGYRTCRADAYPICQEALTDLPTIIVSVGSAPDGMGSCEDQSIWVGVVTLNQRPESPALQYGSVVYLTCVQVDDDETVEIASMTPYWIEN